MQITSARKEDKWQYNVYRETIGLLRSWIRTCTNLCNENGTGEISTDTTWYQFDGLIQLLINYTRFASTRVSFHVLENPNYEIMYIGVKWFLLFLFLFFIFFFFFFFFWCGCLRENETCYWIYLKAKIFSFTEREREREKERERERSNETSVKHQFLCCFRVKCN